MSDLQTILLIVCLAVYLVFPAAVLRILCRHLVKVQEQLLIASAVRDDATARQQFVTGLGTLRSPDRPAAELPIVPDDLEDRPGPTQFLASMLGAGPMLGAPAGERRSGDMPMCLAEFEGKR